MSWPRLILLSLDWLWTLGASAALAGAALAAASPAGARRLLELAERLERGSGRRAARLAWGLAVPLLSAAYKWAQFASFQLMGDSGRPAQAAWQVAHGHGVDTVLLGGGNPLLFHFTFVFELMAPLLWLWPSSAALAVAQGAAVGSSVPAVYLLARRWTGHPAWAWAMALLAFANPFFQHLCGSILAPYALALPLTLWGTCLWAAGRRGWAALCAFLLLGTGEQAPFILFGAGLCALAAGRSPGDRRLGAALAAGAPLVWAGEMAVIRRARLSAPDFGGFWGLFGAIGGSPEAVLETALRRPWAVAAALVVPPAKLWPPLRTLLSLGLLPLGAGALLLPALFAWLPHQLADAGTAYHQLWGHYSCYIYGPLLAASARGLKTIESRLAPGSRRLLLAWLLAVCGAGFLKSSFFLPEEMLPGSLLRAAPRALAVIPPESKVWCEEFFLPHLAMRRYVKELGLGADPFFYNQLFVPDHVLVSRRWLARAEPAHRERILGFLRREGYAASFGEEGLLVLSRAPGKRAAGVEWLALDERGGAP